MSSAWAPFKQRKSYPERAAMFDAYMAELTRRWVAAILAAHDFSRLCRIVDIGGGNGVLLSAILAAFPQAEGMVFDTAAGITGAAQRLEKRASLQRCRIVAGDFFDAVPQGADTYILKSVLHDWDDDEPIAILKNCRRAMRPDSALLVIERVLPERMECFRRAPRNHDDGHAHAGGARRPRAHRSRIQ